MPQLGIEVSFGFFLDFEDLTLLEKVFHFEEGC